MGRLEICSRVLIGLVGQIYMEASGLPFAQRDDILVDDLKLIRL